MLKNVRRMMSDRKGFTLVELIVVLVILSVLAAMLAPSMTGYIDKAKGKRVEAELHQAVVAAQTLADEAYALGKDYSGITLAGIQELAELKGNLNAVSVEKESGKVAYVELELDEVAGYYTEAGITMEKPETDFTGDDYEVIPEGTEEG